MSQADAIRAASAFLKRPDIMQTFAGDDKAYDLGELNALIDPNNLINGRNNQVVLTYRTENGSVPVDPKVKQGIELLASCQDGVPVINVLANTVIEDNTPVDTRLTTLSDADLGQLEKNTRKSLGFLPTGQSLDALMNQATENLNRFWNPSDWGSNPVNLFTSHKDFDLNGGNTPYSDLQNQQTDTQPVVSADNEAVESQVQDILAEVQDLVQAHTDKLADETWQAVPANTGNYWSNSNSTPQGYSQSLLDAFYDLNFANQLAEQLNGLFSSETQTPEQLAVAKRLLAEANQTYEQGLTQVEKTQDDPTEKVANLKRLYTAVGRKLDRLPDKLQRAEDTLTEVQGDKRAGSNRSDDPSQRGDFTPPGLGTVAAGAVSLIPAAAAFHGGLALAPTAAAIPAFAGAVAAAPWIVGGIAAAGVVAGGMWLGHQLDKQWQRH
jgi:hypothetical protein